MSEEHPHPMLAQLPLTVSPFVSLPTATPLPYSYKQLPSTLPPSVTDTHQDPSTSAPDYQPQPAAYVVSQSGHSAHPDQIIASCRALQAHLQKLQDDATATVRKWQDGITERELMEKRRVAPGWLDRDQKMLVPERTGQQSGAGLPVQSLLDDAMDVDAPGKATEQRLDGGEELDRAFGGMGLR